MSTTCTRQRKTTRRPLRCMAVVAAIGMARPVASLTMRKSNVSIDPSKVSGSPRDLSEFMPSARRTQSTLPSAVALSELKMICDERQEFELNLGKAVDTLKRDYPAILTCPPGT